MEMNSVIELAYRSVPDYLRQCFLYFGAFQEDEEIQVSKLIRLWTAEGFLKKTEGRSFEDVGMDYLEDLIGRNLVFVCRRSYAGVVKSCVIHDILHDFCLVEANSRNFFQRMLEYGKVANTPHSVTCEHRRLFISSNWGYNTSLKVFGPLVRSLVLIGGISQFSGSDITDMYQDFKLLRVLDLECINVGNAFPVGLEKMVLLRYLAVRGEMTSIPSSIGSLQQLQTFIALGLSGEVAVPAEIWNLINLRHLHINPASFGALDPEYRQELSGDLPNLRTLSAPSLSCGEDTLNTLRRLPRSLVKLKCIVLESKGPPTKTNVLPKMDFLSRLDSLKMICHVATAPTSWKFSFPSGLRRLSLSGFRLVWDQISMIGSLPNLEALKLLNNACDGSLWEITEDEFTALRFLKLDTLNFEEWYCYEEAFPILERLELHNCKELKEIPACFGDVVTLKEINLKGCSESVESSALMIKSYVKDMTGGDTLQVILHQNDES